MSPPDQPTRWGPNKNTIDVKTTDVASVEIIGKVEETRAVAGGIIVPDHVRPSSHQLSLLVVIGMHDAHRNVYPAHVFRLAIANDEKPDPTEMLDRFEAMIHGAIEKAKMEWALAQPLREVKEGETDDS